jgi:hypothetical protein
MQDKETLFKLLKNDVCHQCKINVAEDLHTCPYREDIDGDCETTCNCCADCEYCCCQEI